MAGEPNARQTLALLLGASVFPRAPKFAQGRAFYSSAQDFREYLTAADGLGLTADNVNWWLFDDNRSPGDQLQEVRDFLERRSNALKSEGTPAQDLILFYVGHGLFAGPDYCLAVRGTVARSEGFTSIRVRDLASALKDQARFLRKFLILDCCFSAQAYKEFQSAPMTVARLKLLEELPQRGTTLLCSSSAQDASIAPEGHPRTMFSDSLLRVLHQGDSHLGPKLSLNELGDLVTLDIRETFKDSAVRPEVHSPERREGDIAGLAFFPNPAWARRVAEELESGARERVLAERRTREAEEIERQREVQPRVEDEARGLQEAAREREEEEQKAREAAAKAALVEAERHLNARRLEEAETRERESAERRARETAAEARLVEAEQRLRVQCREEADARDKEAAERATPEAGREIPAGMAVAAARPGHERRSECGTRTNTTHGATIDGVAVSAAIAPKMQRNGAQRRLAALVRSVQAWVWVLSCAVVLCGILASGRLFRPKSAPTPKQSASQHVAAEKQQSGPQAQPPQAPPQGTTQTSAGQTIQEKPAATSSPAQTAKQGHPQTRQKPAEPPPSPGSAKVMSGSPAETASQHAAAEKKQTQAQAAPPAVGPGGTMRTGTGTPEQEKPAGNSAPAQTASGGSSFWQRLGASLNRSGAQTAIDSPSQVAQKPAGPSPSSGTATAVPGQPSGTASQPLAAGTQQTASLVPPSQVGSGAVTQTGAGHPVQGKPAASLSTIPSHAVSCITKTLKNEHYEFMGAHDNTIVIYLAAQSQPDMQAEFDAAHSHQAEPKDKADLLAFDGSWLFVAGKAGILHPDRKGGFSFDTDKVKKDRVREALRQLKSESKPIHYVEHEVDDGGSFRAEFGGVYYSIGVKARPREHLAEVTVCPGS
jgi:hypothetical protein